MDLVQSSITNCVGRDYICHRMNKLTTFHFLSCMHCQIIVGICDMSKRMDNRVDEMCTTNDCILPRKSNINDISINFISSLNEYQIAIDMINDTLKDAARLVVNDFNYNISYNHCNIELNTSNDNNDHNCNNDVGV